jgi:[ribosomal protein S5]-alanine N-acetyltransferase
MNDVIATDRLDLVSMTPAFLKSTELGDRRQAEATLGFTVPSEWFECASFAAMRLRQFESGATSQPWLPRGIGLRATGEMVGFIGFHTPPAPDYLKTLCPGAVEFGYTTFPAFRRRRIAWEATQGLISWAHVLHGVASFVVSVSPANAPSLALISKLGFRRIGSHVDEEDGIEDIFALALKNSSHESDS